MIPDETVAEVRARADIVDIIGEFVQLKRAGKEYKGLSPFKQERTPSFFVSPQKAFFHDFSSGESGDVFSFLMKHQGMSFTAAVKYVGARSGVQVREIKRGRGRQDLRRPYYEATAFADSFFQERLRQGEGGQVARRYLEKRGIGLNAAEELGLGYAPGGWRAFRGAAAVHGLEEQLLLELGLLKKSENQDEPYDAFRDRIIFPIESVSGRVTAFGGRLLGPGGKGSPKYLNSPDNPLFHKGHILYGLHRARNHIRRDGLVLIVEGFMDVVSLACAGITNAVAPLGTALTSAQAELLRRYTSEACLLFDSDPAGLRATFRTADILLAQGIHPSVVTLPEGEDPDSVVRVRGADGLQEYLEQSVDVFERKIAILEENDFFSSIAKKRSAVDRLLPTLRAVRDPRLHDLYLARVSERTGIRVRTLEEELGARKPPARQERQPQPPRRPEPRYHGLGSERKLLLLLVRDRALIEAAMERIGPSDLEDRVNRVIFEELIAAPELLALPEGTEDAVIKRFETLMSSPEEITDPAKMFNDVVSRIQVTLLDRRLDILALETGKNMEESERQARVAERLELLKERNELGIDWRRSARTMGALQQEGEGAS